ncbi:MAG: bifunctional diguanylate cyclase/phosphodiesterase, partial [Gammaproteobacteria bacterium]|nr:bifunctional diguanylate cyclase/phosphodiesterase [Gammaproteobacteria bacterium]
ASAVAPVAVILINLGRFSLINSIYGFPSGDAVLRVMANRLITLIGLAECVFRSGSNEFAVVLAMPQSDHGEELIRRILTAISEPFEIRGISLQLPCAIGVAFAPGHGASADELLANAESALVQARGDEISASKVYSEELRTGTRTRLQLESRLRRAIENEELSLAYQPIIRVSDGFLVGFEALLRWTDAKLGVIPPATFIPIAERSGLIEPLGRWVLEIACSQAAEWGMEFDAPVQISVNLSPRQILDLGLPEQVERILENARLPAACLVLEITESLAMQNLDITVDLLNRLRQPGINIALDDFGTGYSSLSYLTRLPIYAIKLDREFIRHLGSSEQVAKTTKMIIQLAPTLGLMVVGEGVETVQQYALLREYGCDLIQGYLFSKPVAPDKARVLLRNRRYFPVPGESAVLDGVSA